jgi:hypothetical protein
MIKRGQSLFLRRRRYYCRRHFCRRRCCRRQSSVYALDNVLGDVDSGVCINQLGILIGRIDNDCEVILFGILLNKRSNLVTDPTENLILHLAKLFLSVVGRALQFGRFGVDALDQGCARVIVQCT